MRILSSGAWSGHVVAKPVDLAKAHSAHPRLTHLANLKHDSSPQSGQQGQQ